MEGMTNYEFFSHPPRPFQDEKLFGFASFIFRLFKDGVAAFHPVASIWCCMEHGCTSEQ